ncbi:hypothetical protein BO70DRAFT_400953 [Aspergillus heteromorphus CBS 117.55]|uniref:Fatty acid desaturase domain-containing protein n=1 Tax=Aspergillus heteromorphus CBS 117.55 TaxID=1448321 RepID=A0A317UVB8_9EURO|nr:uncharacterized protein BO70DRAFT_400953 [Aspergillus heteromorphus CBS 117.55]PWY66003.1 hypothetical protein BO70DRAFT_400953 [Aspergillus heteromorphus CBS 117.55]
MEMEIAGAGLHDARDNDAGPASHNKRRGHDERWSDGAMAEPKSLPSGGTQGSVVLQIAGWPIVSRYPDRVLGSQGQGRSPDKVDPSQIRDFKPWCSYNGFTFYRQTGSPQNVDVGRFTSNLRYLWPLPNTIEGSSLHAITTETLKMNQNSSEESPSLKELKEAIPASCFRPSLLESLAYLARDAVYATALVYGALQIPHLPTVQLRVIAWVAYGFCQGLVGTGIWIIAHECGHGAFSAHRRLNDALGWTLHSILLVPYFSWKITHARHHHYSGHMEKDTVFVPPTEEQYASRKGIDIPALKELGQDAPLLTLLTLVGHQLAGWQMYIFLYSSGGKDSVGRGRAQEGDALNHFNPHGRLFTLEQRWQVVVSDLGLLLMGGFLYQVGTMVGVANVLLLYFMPYVWVHHWIVAITCMHHTHPTIPHYSGDAWSFTKGALGTVDRSFGLMGRHFFHDIIDHHVVHHLFPRIPFYRAEEATRAIQPLLGAAYKEEKRQGFFRSLWRTFRECRYVADTGESGETTGVLAWQSAGPRE